MFDRLISRTWLKRGILRAPTQVVLNITNRCNLSCVYCFNESNEGKFVEELSDSEILGIIDELIQLKPFNVCFSGGEPLLRRDLLFKSIRSLSKAGIRTSLPTNGTLLDPFTCREIVDSGVKEIEISVDGMHARTNNTMGRYHKYFPTIMEALKYLSEINFSYFEVSVTLTSINIGEIIDLINFLLDIGVKRFIFRPVLHAGRAIHHAHTIYLSSLQLREIRYEINELVVGKQGRQNILFHFADSLNHVRYFSEILPLFCMEIKSNGSLIASPYFPVSLGNIKKHSIIEYWNAGWENIWTTRLFKSIYSKLHDGYDVGEIYELVKKIKGIDLIDFPEGLNYEIKG